MADESIYRVTREDTHGRYFHAPLVKVGTRRMLAALLADTYSRYKITKIERVPVEAWEDVTDAWGASIEEGACCPLPVPAG